MMTTTNDEYFRVLKDIRMSYIQNWNGNKRQDPYKFGDFFSIATPIEMNMWTMCRMWGLEMYPQFPVGKYYLDFANPFIKVCIEVDGKIHQEQIAKDRKRDDDLLKSGWRVYRIQGWKTYSDYSDFDEDEDSIYESRSAEFLIRKLAKQYKSFEKKEDNEIVDVSYFIEQINNDRERMVEQLKLNKILFGYTIPSNIGYRAQESL